jgi:hypothetical protein
MHPIRLPLRARMLRRGPFPTCLAQYPTWLDSQRLLAITTETPERRAGVSRAAVPLPLGHELRASHHRSPEVGTEFVGQLLGRSSRAVPLLPVQQGRQRLPVDFSGGVRR